MMWGWHGGYGCSGGMIVTVVVVARWGCEPWSPWVVGHQPWSPWVVLMVFWGGCCGVCGCGVWGLRGVVCGASGGMEVIYK